MTSWRGIMAELVDAAYPIVLESLERVADGIPQDAGVVAGKVVEALISLMQDAARQGKSDQKNAVSLSVAEANRHFVLDPAWIQQQPTKGPETKEKV